MDEDLKKIVQAMIDAGESEANIAKVIQAYSPAVKKKDATSESVSASDPTLISLGSEGAKPELQAKATRGSDISDSGEKVYSGYPGKEGNQYRIVKGKWQRKKPHPSGSGGVPTLTSMMSPAEEWHEVKSEGAINGLNDYFKVKGSIKLPVSIVSTREKLKPNIVDTGKLSESEIKIKKDAPTHRWMGPQPELVPLKDYSGEMDITQSRWKELEEAKQQETSRLKNSDATPDQIAQVVAGYDAKIKIQFDNFEAITSNEAQNKAEALGSIANYQESDQSKRLKKEITGKMFTYEEESVVEAFNNSRFRDLGFLFHETGLGDAMEVESYTGKTMIIDLDVYPEDAEAEAKKLRGFIIQHGVAKEKTAFQKRKSQEEIENMTMEEFKTHMVNEYANSPERFNDDQSELVNTILSDKLSDLSGQSKDYKSHEAEMGTRVSDFEARIVANGGVLTDEMKVEYNELQSDLDDLNTEAAAIELKYNTILEQESAVNATAASRMRAKMKEEATQGSFWGGVGNKLLSGLTVPASTATSLSSNLMPYFLPNAGMDPQMYETLQGQGLSESEIRDMSKKDLLKRIIPEVERGLVDIFGSETTEAYLNSEDRSTFEKAVFGLAETIPSLVAGGGNKALSFLNLAAMSYSQVESEMMNNPEFANISESEKKLISIPYAIVMGALENLGFTKLMSKSPLAQSFTSKIITSVFGSVPKNASIDVIESALKIAVRKKMSSGLFKIIDGMLVEGETGALQEVADIGIKEVYNAIKGKDIFETPESFAAGVSQVWEGAKMEAIGGGILKTGMLAPSIISKGMKKSKISDEDADLLMDIGTDSGMRSIFRNKLMLMVFKKEVTLEVANETLKSYDEMMGIVGKIPKGTTDIPQAYDLLSEKKKLEAEIKGKDEAVSKKQRDRIAEINEELEVISKAERVADPEVETDTEVEAITEETRAKNQTRLDNRVARAKDNLAKAKTLKEKLRVIVSYKNNTATLKERGTTVSEEDAAIFEQAEQALEAEGYTINSVEIGTDIVEGHIIEIDYKEYVDGAENLITEDTKKTVTNVIMPEVLRDGNQVERGKVKVEIRPKTVEELENDISTNERTLIAEKKAGVDSASTKQEIKRIKDRIKVEEERLNDTKSKEDVRQETTTEAAAGNRLFNEPLEDATTIADRIAAGKIPDSEGAGGTDGAKVTDTKAPKGEGPSQVERIIKLDEKRSKEISDAYDQMENNPNDPEVKEAYQALVEETIAQYDEIIASGYSVEINNNEPYANSQEMIEDLRGRKTMKIFSTEAGYGDGGITDQQRKENPMLAKTKYKDANGVPLLVNDVFRFVHDFFGHSKLGNGFGPIGEENAWNTHSQMYSPKARRAMTTETRGQNSWVNFSGANTEAFALRDEARALRKEAKALKSEVDVLINEGKLDQAEVKHSEAEAKFKEASVKSDQVYEMMEFAEQKIGIIDAKYSKTDSEIKAEETVSTETAAETKKESETKKVDESKEAPGKTEVTDTFKSAFTKSADSAIEWLNKIDDDLKNFGKDTLGINLTPAAARIAIKAAKVAVQAGKTISEIIDASIRAVRKTEWYKGLSAADKKKAEIKTQRLFTDPVKEKKSPSVAKILRKPKAKKIKPITERAALRSQLVMEARAARKASKFEKGVRKELSKPVAAIISKITGKVSPRQLKAITKRALSDNLSNPVMADRFIDYVQKVANDANYTEKIKNAFEIRKSLKNISKGKKIQSEVKKFLNDFTKLDPRYAEDIDQYNEMAELLKSFAKPSSVRQGKLKMKDFPDLDPVRDYLDNQLERQESINKDMMELQFEELFTEGILNRNMSVNEMREVIATIGSVGGPTLKDDSEIMATLTSAYDVYATSLEGIQKNGIDPYTGNEVDLTSAQKYALNAILGIDMNTLSLKEQIQVVDMMGNLSVNGISGNVENVASYFEGRKNAAKFFKKNGKAKRMPGALRGFDYYFASLPMLIDTMVNGISKGSQFMMESGLFELIRGSNLAQKLMSVTLDSYINKFKKTKPNGSDFNSAKNNYERGIISFLKRSVSGTVSEIKDEFDRRKRIIKETIEHLNSDMASKKESKKGKLYQEAYDKLDLDSSTYESFESKADPVNVEAVNWWISEWESKYDSISDVSRNVYNNELSRDLNFTPDRYKLKDSSRVPDVEDVMNGAFGSFSDSAHNKESSVMMKSNKPKVLPKNRVIDLDFDVNNYSAMEAAMVDVHTAKAIRKVEGFKQSEAFSRMFSIEDGNNLRDRINNYIIRTKGKEFVRNDQTKTLKQISNAMAKYGTSLALGGMDQLPKQTVSVMMNTLINSGGKTGLIDAMSQEAIDWINNSGMPISMRGLAAETSIDVSEKRLDKKAEGSQKIIKVIGVVNDYYLKKFLAQPDKFVARASFIAFYKKNLKSRGLSQDINFDVEMDAEAANYAQHMVDRQQNISDYNLAGEFFASRSIGLDFIKKGLFPFANFIMNQKVRMWADVRTIFSKSSSSSDKASAAKSLGGLAVEMMTFHAMSIGLRVAFKLAANYITGYEPDEEAKWITKEVNKENRRRELKGQLPFTDEQELEYRYKVLYEAESDGNWKSFWSSVVTDIFSPFPPADKFIVKGLNLGLKEGNMALNSDSEEADIEVKIQNMMLLDSDKDIMNDAQEERFRKKWASEDAFEFWDWNNESLIPGVVGIGVTAVEEFSVMNQAASEGTIVTKDFQGKDQLRFLTPENQEIAKLNRWSMALYLTRLLPSDFGKESRYIQKNLKKSSLTEIQYGKYMEIYNKNGSVTDEEFKTIKSGGKIKPKPSSEAVYL